MGSTRVRCKYTVTVGSTGMRCKYTMTWGMVRKQQYSLTDIMTVHSSPIVERQRHNVNSYVGRISHFADSEQTESTRHTVFSIITGIFHNSQLARTQIHIVSHIDRFHSLSILGQTGHTVFHMLTYSTLKNGGETTTQSCTC